MNVVLIGAGGHAKAVVEAIHAKGWQVDSYVDQRPAPWLQAKRLANDADVHDARLAAVIGVGGLVPEQLQRRLALLDAWKTRGFATPEIVHRTAHISPSARVESGVLVLAGAIVQPGAVLERGVIVNSGAIVEHDSRVGAGTHVAPGAVVLADCTVGACVIVGANSVVLRGTTVPDSTLIKAASLFRGDRDKD